MAEDLLTINGLSEETGLDRRTLKKWLALLPCTEKRGRWKYWDRERAVRFIDQLEKAIDDGVTIKQIQCVIQNHIEFVSGDYLPKLMENCLPAFTGLLHREHGLSKVDAVKAWEALCLVMVIETDEYFGQELGYDLSKTSWFEDRAEKSVEELVATHWPDDASEC